MKLFELRKNLKLLFDQHEIEVVDADFIVAEVLNVKRTDLALIEEITDKQLNLINKAVEKRLRNMPIEKIFKKAYFYGLEFKVDENVLSPRPETELLVEKAINYIQKNGYCDVLDLCTGSGCLAITIKKNTNSNVTASDVSVKALEIAKFNAKKHSADIDFVESDMFEKINKKFDLIITNPPYIDTDEVKELDKEVKYYDPLLALDGGDMGLKFYNIIHNNLRNYLNDGGMIIMEIGEGQKDILISMFNDFNLVEAVEDLAGNDRILIFSKGIKNFN